MRIEKGDSIGEVPAEQVRGLLRRHRVAVLAAVLWLALPSCMAARILMGTVGTEDEYEYEQQQKRQQERDERIAAEQREIRRQENAWRERCEAKFDDCKVRHPVRPDDTTYLRDGPLTSEHHRGCAIDRDHCLGRRDELGERLGPYDWSTSAECVSRYNVCAREAYAIHGAAMLRAEAGLLCTEQQDECLANLEPDFRTRVRRLCGARTRNQMDYDECTRGLDGSIRSDRVPAPARSRDDEPAAAPRPFPAPCPTGDLCCVTAV
jgi:hypothetical protein